jgi:hypothetical protein
MSMLTSQVATVVTKGMLSSYEKVVIMLFHLQL